jgi:hypothetical protein
MDAANVKGSIQFVKEYSFLEAYGLPDFTLASWIKLNDLINQQHSVHTLYKKYRYVSSSTEQHHLMHVEAHYDGKEVFQGKSGHN